MPTPESPPQPGTDTAKSEHLLSPEVLAHFRMLDSLSEDQRILIAGKADIHEANAGEDVVDAENEDGLEYFLLDGEVTLSTCDDQEKLTINAESSEARLPLSGRRPRTHHVTAATPIRYFTMDAGLLRRLLSESPIDHYSVKPQLRENQEDSKQVFFDIYTDLRNNKLSLPSLPEVAVRIRKLIDDGKANAKTIAKAVSVDPAITAKLIKASNSAMYRGTKRFETATQAIIRLGLQVTKQLVTSFTIRELFTAESPQIKMRMDDMWQHSIDVAAVSFVLARHLPSIDPEQALLAGLLHDIGTVPILIYAEKYPDLIDSPELLERCIHDLRGEVGSMIMKRWGFSEELVEVAKHSSDWHYNSGEGIQLCDIVIIAQLYSYIGTPRANALPSLDSVPAYGKMPMAEDGSDDNLSILEEAKEQLDDTKALLLG